jgi:hypothetical protein
LALNRPIRCFVVPLPQTVDLVHHYPRHSILLEPDF